MPTYTPPPGGSVTVALGDSAYTSPNAASVTIELDGATSSTIFHTSILDDGYGTPTLKWTLFVESVSVGDLSAFGTHELDFHRLRPDGIASTLEFGDAYIYLGQQWVYPDSIVVESQAGHWVYRDDYYIAPVNAPDASALVVELGSLAFTPPSASFVVVELEPAGAATIYPQPINDSAVGSATVENYLTYALPSGIPAGDVGSHTASQPPVLFPSGIDQNKFGFSGDGAGFIDFARRELAPASIFPTAFGTTRVESTVRDVDVAGRGPLGTLFGTQFIAYKERFVYPPYIFANALGIATIGFTRELQPSGIDDLTFGVADVHDNTQSVQGAGVGRSDGVQIPIVTRSPRTITPSGFDLREIAPSERWGRPEVYNLTQILPRVAIDADPENGGVFGEPNNTLVENRNRTIVHYGHRDSIVSPLATIDNTGRALLSSGVEATAWGDALIAPAIRSYSLDGIAPEWFTPYHAVYNTAFQALPSGIAPGSVGVPEWANPPQNITFVGHIDSQEHGTAFVDFAVRYIATPLGPEAVSGWHTVELSTRYVAPAGIEATAWGATYVFEHFNIAAAHSILPPTMPLEHYVRNVTPQVYPYGYDLTEWGTPTVRWNPWPISPDGFVAGEYGRLVIRDRRQTAVAPGIGAGQVGQFAQVRNDSPDPPSNRSVVPSGILGTSYGSPSLRRNEIDAGGIVFTSFGTHEVRLVGALVPGIAVPSSQIPSPIVKGPRTLFPSTDGLSPPDDDPRATFHDLSPRTIWATFDVTEQASENHPGEWELMDDYLDTVEPKGSRPFFGAAAVSLKNRRITVGAASDSMSPQEFPEPMVESTIRKIYPSGKLMQRFGVPSLPGEQLLSMDGGGFADAVVGYPAVENFDKDILPGGIQSPPLSQQDIQNFHRELAVASVGVGAPGSPRVHPPEPVIPKLGIQTLWGDAMVAPRIRTLYPSGWDSFVDGEEFGRFSDRMRVTKRYPIRPTSIDGGSVGGHRVSDAVQIVQHATLPPPGKPMAPDVRINNVIALGGLGEWFGAYGETVITHGDNLEFVCGESSRAIPIPGINEGDTFGVTSIQ